MFRPNRIGTPHVNGTSNITSSDPGPPSQSGNFTNTYLGNICNATSALDFGRSNFFHTPSVPMSITLENKFFIAQQFTVTEPLDGDTVGVECTGEIIIACAQPVILVPFVSRLVAAASTTYEVAQLVDPPTGFDCEPQQSLSATFNRVYKNQALLRRATKADVAGPYCHGFLVYSQSANTVFYYRFGAAVRQLNDQQTVSYRDTLR